jgi:hypothetical protein
VLELDEEEVDFDIDELLAEVWEDVFDVGVMVLRAEETDDTAFIRVK